MLDYLKKKPYNENLTSWLADRQEGIMAPSDNTVKPIVKGLNFALIGAAGYVAPQHMRAIRDTGSRAILQFLQRLPAQQRFGWLDTEDFANYYDHNNYHLRTSMDEIQQIMPITKVKRGFLDIVKTMQEDDSTITLTKNGKPVGVMMTPNRYEALLETIEILADKDVMLALRSSADDFRAGRVHEDTTIWDD